MSNYNKRISDTTIRLGEVRFSYVNVFAKRRNEDGSEGKYSTAILVPKSDTKAVQLIRDAYKAACEKGKVSKWEGKIPASVANKDPLHDGDTEKDDEVYAGHWYFNASSNNQPQVSIREDGTVSEAFDSGDFYSGCYGCCVVNLYPFKAQGNTGVAFGLNSVCKTRDGEKLGGGASTPEQDYGDLID